MRSPRPDVLGLIGLVTVFTGFAQIYADLGLSAALIQKQDVTEEHFSTVFWINVAGGAILSLGTAAAAPGIATFYGREILVPITLALSVNFLVGSTGIIHSVRFTRALDFRTLALIDITATAVSGSLGIALALTGWGVWSLVAQSIAQNIVRVVGLWVVGDWRPRIEFHWHALTDLMGFSANLLGFSTLNYWTRNGDNLLIGKFLGSTPLGLYSKAYSTMLFPVQNISGQISRVMFPASSQIQADPQRISSIYLRMTRTIALLTFPMMVGVSVVAEPFVLALFGTSGSI